MTVTELVLAAEKNGLKYTVGPAAKLPGFPVNDHFPQPARKRTESTGAPQAEVFQNLAMFCQAMGYPIPVQNYRFHDTRRWELDIAFVEEQIAVELNGGLHTGVGHARLASAENDYSKLDAARRLGWITRSFSYPQVKRGDLLRWLEEEFRFAKTGSYE